MPPNPQGTIKEPSSEPQRNAREAASRRIVDDDEFAESAIGVANKWRATFQITKGYRDNEIAQAVNEYGVDACMVIIGQLVDQGMDRPPTEWLLQRLKRGDHNKKPRRGRRERNDPVTDQAEMMANIDAMERDGWKIAGR